MAGPTNIIKLSMMLVKLIRLLSRSRNIKLTRQATSNMYIELFVNTGPTARNIMETWRGQQINNAVDDGRPIKFLLGPLSRCKKQSYNNKYQNSDMTGPQK